jgi:hypothetical protein
MLPELSDVTNTVEEPRTELVFRPDRAALADFGLTVGQVGQALRASIEGAPSGVFRGEVGRERDIRVRLEEDARRRAAQVGELQHPDAAGVPCRCPPSARSRSWKARRRSSASTARAPSRWRAHRPGCAHGCGGGHRGAHAEAPLPPGYTYGSPASSRPSVTRSAPCTRGADPGHHPDVHRAGHDPGVVRAPHHHRCGGCSSCCDEENLASCTSSWWASRSWRPASPRRARASRPACCARSVPPRLRPLRRLLATVLVQSSSVSTATIVGMVGAGTLPLSWPCP